MKDWWNDSDQLPLEIQLAGLPLEYVKPERSKPRRKRPCAASRMNLIRYYGAYCWLCLAYGKSKDVASINLKLPRNDPREFTKDHVVPKSRGGVGSFDNLRPAHRKCNEERGNFSPIWLINFADSLDPSIVSC